MILTVTLNTAIDKILFIDEWVPGTVMRTPKVVTSVGGKGLDSSVTLRHLGVETVGICFVAGKIGEELIEQVKRYGITSEPIWVGGETRVAHVISELKHHRHSHIIAGSISVAQNHCDELIQKFKVRVHEASYVICSGSIPLTLTTSLYRTITELAHDAKVPVLIDSVDAFILESLPARPDIIKMNDREFALTFGMNSSSLDSLKKQALMIYRERKLQNLVLTCATEGILAVSPEGAYHAYAPIQEAVNAAGAGDAVSSALAWRLSEGDRWPEALRWAAATSAAVVLTEGTADCNRNDIEKIYPKVIVQPF